MCGVYLKDWEKLVNEIIMKKILVAVSLTLCDCTELKTKFTTLEKGQIWEFCPNGKNPFKTTSDCHQFTVLVVKDGYVQYSDTDGNIYSSPEDYFKIGSEKIDDRKYLSGDKINDLRRLSE